METRILDQDSLYLLEDCLTELADYHNQVAESFKGLYPLRPFKEVLEGIAAQLETGKAKVNAVFEGKVLVGFCKITLGDPLASLDYLYLKADYRGKGLGRELMDWAMDCFDDSDAKAVDVKVVIGNSTQQMYEKFGFQPRSIIMTQELQ